MLAICSKLHSDLTMFVRSLPKHRLKCNSKPNLSVQRRIWSVLVFPSPTERRGGGMSGCVCFNRPAPKPAATGRPPLLPQPGPCARAKAATKREASMGTPPAWLGRKKREGNRREGRQAAQKSRGKAFYPEVAIVSAGSLKWRERGLQACVWGGFGGWGRRPWIN